MHIQRFFPNRPFFLFLSLLAALTTQPTHAQVHSRAEHARRGFELELHGALQVREGRTLQLSGIAYAVEGLATLIPLSEGGHVDAKITARFTDHDETIELGHAHAVTGEHGHFTMEVPCGHFLGADGRPHPFAPPELRMIVGDDHALRGFETMQLSVAPAFEVTMLTDREMYEPGETIHVWTRTTDAVSGRTALNGNVQFRWTMQGDSGPREQTVAIGPTQGGVASLDIPVPDNGATSITIISTVDGAVPDGAVRMVHIGRHAISRMLVDVSLNAKVIAPMETLEARVHVTTPSGNPVSGATINVSDSFTGNTLSGTSNDDGVFTAKIEANSHMTEDSATSTLDVTARHPGYGTMGANATYTIARVPVLVEALAQNGALVVLSQSGAFLSVTNADGSPVTAGTEVRVKGAATGDATRTVTTDAHGFAFVPLFVPPEAVAIPQQGKCATRPSTTLDVIIGHDAVRVAHLCLPVSLDSGVAMHAHAADAHVGESVTIDLARTRSLENHPVFVELLQNHIQIASAWAGAHDDRIAIAIPASARGVITARAFVFLRENATTPWTATAPGLFSAPTYEPILVRSLHAFSIDLAASPDPARIRDHVTLRATTSSPAGDAHLAFVVRDLAMDGGGNPWHDETWVQNLLSAPTTPNDAAISLRALLTATIGRADNEHPAAVDAIGDAIAQTGNDQTHGASLALRDPELSRATLLRQTVRNEMAVVDSWFSAANLDALREVTERKNGALDFEANALSAIHENNGERPVTLGGDPMTIADLHDVDATFTFARIARRSARSKLTVLLAELAHLTDPQNLNGARAIASVDPSEWLAKLPSSSAVGVDPWGRPFAFRDSHRAPRIVISERYPAYEVVSAGADGVFGNADDVRDPFERVVPEGSLFAIATGEDILMAALATIAPGPRVLSQLLGAYATTTVAMAEDAAGSVVQSSASEAIPQQAMRSAMAPMAAAEDSAGMGAIGTVGGGGGGTGEGYGHGAGRFAASRAASPTIRSAAPDANAHAPASTRGKASLSSRFDALGEDARERFPATLFYMPHTAFKPRADGQASFAEVPFDAADALTTYRVDAIAWNADGWTTIATTEFRVDQDAVVDAPIPPFVTTGDLIKLPVRLSNRSSHPISAAIDVATDGDIALSIVGELHLDARANDVAEDFLTLHADHIGTGHLTIRARTTDGTVLDAVKRPIEITADERLVRAQTESLISGALDARIVIPQEAHARGQAEIHVVPAAALFGDPAHWNGDHQFAAWTLAMLHRDIPSALRNEARTIVTNQSASAQFHFDFPTLARAMSVAWSDDSVNDDAFARLFVTLTARWGETLGSPRADLSSLRATMLLGIAPLAADLAHRPALSDTASRFITDLRTAVSNGSATLTDAKEQILVASALALTSATDENGRAIEMIRRANDRVVRFEDTAFVSTNTADPTAKSRVLVTSLLALAELSLGHREAAMALFRSVLAARETLSDWDNESRAYATLLASRIAPGFGDATATVVVDDDTLTSHLGGEGAFACTSSNLNAAGTHTLHVSTPSQSLAVASVTLPYAVPWSVEPSRRAPIALSIEGDAGNADSVTEFTIVVQNKGGRSLVSPVLDIDLPAGAELVNVAQHSFDAAVIGSPGLDHRRLHIALASIAPTATVRLPLKMRFSVGGTIHGFGVVAEDTSIATSTASRTLAILPSREITIGVGQ